MSKKNKKNNALKNKKEKVMQGGPQKKNKGPFIGIALGIAIFAFVGFVLFGGNSSPFQVVTAEAGIVSIPVGKVSDGKAHYYTYKGTDRKINFFVLKSSDGVYRAAFDACDVCFREKKGYQHDGDHMVCRNCGQRFSSVNINVIKGGCNPAPLNRALKGNNLVFNVSDIESGKYYF
jgi:uncharacterized membrane protein